MLRRERSSRVSGPTMSVVDTALKQRLGKEQRSAAGWGPESGSELGDAIYRKVSKAW
jgi:hypothetical protein